VETLKIVARWMEEDRLSGRVVLGGVSKTGSMFGWNDPSPPPMAVSSAFAAKHARTAPQARPSPDLPTDIPRERPQGPVIDRSPSKTRSYSKARIRSSTRAAHLPHDIKPEITPQAPHFGWSSSPGNDSGPELQISQAKLVRDSDSSTIPITVNNGSSSRRTTSSSPPPPPTESPDPSQIVQHGPTAHFDPNARSPLSTKRLNPSLPDSLELASVSNDDDWGEMVSSPVFQTAPPLPISGELRHKKSMSLGSPFITGTSNTPTIGQSISASRSGRGHKQTMSFSDILQPSIKSPNLSRRDTPPMKMFSTDTAATNQDSQSLKGTISSPEIDGLDPWAFADFSFFESETVNPPKAERSSIPKATAENVVPFGRAIDLVSLRRNQRSKEEMAQDMIVESVLKSLPDLSYMFR